MIPDFRVFFDALWTTGCWGQGRRTGLRNKPGYVRTEPGAPFHTGTFPQCPYIVFTEIKIAGRT